MPHVPIGDRILNRGINFHPMFVLENWQDANPVPRKTLEKFYRGG
jgi:hypothetical protein